MSSVALSKKALALLLAAETANSLVISPSINRPSAAVRNAPHVAFSMPHAAAERLRFSHLLMQADAAVGEVHPVPDAFFESRTPYLADVDEYKAMHARSIEDPEGFWGEIASQFHWEKKWDKVVDSNFASSKGKVFSKWFEGGKTNICYNAIDRHVKDGFGDQIAFYHEANDEDDEVESWTYAQALDEVSRLANVLKAKGVRRATA